MDEEVLWDQAIARLATLFPDKRKRGTIKGRLLQLDVRHRLRYFEDDDEVTRSTLEVLATGLATVDPKDKLYTMLEQVVRWMDAVTELQLLDFAEQSTPSVRRDEFKKTVTQFYQPVPDKATPSGQTTHMKCMASGIVANVGDLQAGHVIPYNQGKYALLMGLDVNSPRNGILWLSVLERAWSNAQFCFRCTPGSQDILFTLLDMELENVRLCDYPRRVEGRGIVLSRDTEQAMGNTTFGQLHMTGKLEMLWSPEQRPSRRALCFMSHIQRSLAARNKQTVSPEAEDNKNFDYWSEHDVIDKLQLKLAPTAVATWLTKLQQLEQVQADVELQPLTSLQQPQPP